MSKKTRVKTVFLLALLLGACVTLMMTLSPSLPFSVSAQKNTKYFITAYPARVQEGVGTNITVTLREASVNATYPLKINVTAPTGTSYVSNVTVKTDEDGYGNIMKKFLSDFWPTANTNHVGVYRMSVNQTLATSDFTVGLTDKLKYLREGTVNIRGAGYAANETIKLDIKLDGLSATGFPPNVTASPNGVVIDSWVIPTDASLGVYTLTLSNATVGGTVKSPADVQTFAVESIVEIQTRNLADQAVSGVSVEIYNATSGAHVNLSQETNETGWVKFQLPTGNYTFKTFWKNVEVGAVNQLVTGNVIQSSNVSLSNIEITVKDEASALLPLIDLTLKYNYTTRANKTITETSSFTTNINGTLRMLNVLPRISYLVEARKYGALFNTTLIASLPAQSWNNITLIAPTYTMFVQMLDSKNAPASNLEIEVYEWSSGIGEPLQTAQTDINGNVTFSLTFGRYKLRAYQGTTFVNEFTVDLVQNPLFFVTHIDVYNLDLNVFVIDYFGQPIPNVTVELQRKNDADYQTTQTKTTGSNGVASFNNVIGGDSQIHVSVAGTQGQMQSLYLVGPALDVVFKMDGYVSVAGYILETGQFTTIAFLIVLVVAFIIISTYKKIRIPRLFQRKKK